MNAALLGQVPKVADVAKQAGAAFIIGAAGASGVVVGLGVGGMVLGNVAKKKLIGFYADFKRAK
jgi:hypothetical protein